MPPEGYYERRFSSLGGEILEKSNLIPINLDSITAEKTNSFREFAKRMEMKAAEEERFEDAIKWRDIPERGTVYILCDDANEQFTVCDNPFGGIDF